MAAVTQLLQIIIPFFVGMGAARVLSDPERLRKPLNDYIVFIGLPLFLIHILSQVDLGEIARFASVSVTVLVALTVVSFLVVPRLVSDERKRPAFYLNGIYGNTGFLGLPLSYFIFGAEGLAIAAVYSISTTIIQFTLGIVAAEGLRGKVGRDVLTKAARFPSIYIVVVVLLISRWTIEFPQPVLYMSEAVVYIAPFIIGMTCTFSSFDRDTVKLGAFKMLLPIPLIVAVVMLFGASDPAITAGLWVFVLAASLPPALVNTSVSLHFDYDEVFSAEATSILTFVHILVVLTLSVIFIGLPGL